jgi:hypothetical protein
MQTGPAPPSTQVSVPVQHTAPHGVAQQLKPPSPSAMQWPPAPQHCKPQSFGPQNPLDPQQERPPLQVELSAQGAPQPSELPPSSRKHWVPAAQQTGAQGLSQQAKVMQAAPVWQQKRPQGLAQHSPLMQESGPRGQQAPPSPQLLPWQKLTPSVTSGAQQEALAEPAHCAALTHEATQPPSCSSGQAWSAAQHCVPHGFWQQLPFTQAWPVVQHTAPQGIGQQSPSMQP